MKKIRVLISAQDEVSALRELERLGTLHLEPLQSPTNQRTEELEADAKTLHQAMALFPDASERAGRDVLELASSQIKAVVREAEEAIVAMAELEASRQRLAGWVNQAEQQSYLGGFDPKWLEKLREKDVQARIYLCPNAELENCLSRSDVYEIGHKHGEGVVLQLARNSKQTLPLRPLEWPEHSLQALGDLKAKEENRIALLEGETILDGPRLRRWRAALAWHQQALAWERARAGMGRETGLVFLQGYCPATRLSSVEEVAQKAGWALWVTDPADDDPVPTLVRSSRWGAMFEPIMRFLGITPGYREYDTNGLFLVFFSIFFAMILGDGGYGLLLFVATFFVARAWSKARGTVALLLYTLAVATMGWGAVTGMWFGSETLARLPGLRNLTIPSLGAFAPDTEFIMRLCLWLGTLHLILAHGWVALRKHGWGSLAEVGWGGLILGLYYVSAWILLGDQLPQQLLGLIGLAGGLLLIFGEQGSRYSWTALGSNLSNFPLLLLSGIGGFSDIVSYLRLFAVGMAGNEIAIAFNQMAGQVATGGVGALLLAGVLLVAGHTLNVLLGVMGVLVHGVRLNLLEFSRHLNVSWSGIPFRPFGMEWPRAAQEGKVRN